MAKIFHPLLAMIASGTDRELAKYVQFLKAENKILRAQRSIKIQVDWDSVSAGAVSGQSLPGIQARRTVWQNVPY